MIRHLVIMDKKAAISSGIATLVLLSAALSGAMAENFAVGDQRGWMVPNGGLNYTVWAENITAHVGDSLCKSDSLIIFPPCRAGLLLI